MPELSQRKVCVRERYLEQREGGREGARVAEVAVGVGAGGEVGEAAGLVLEGRRGAVAGEVVREGVAAVGEGALVGEVEQVEQVAALIAQVQLGQPVEEGAVAALEVLEGEEGVHVALHHRRAVQAVDLHLDYVPVAHQPARLVPEEDLRVLRRALQHAPEAQPLLCLQRGPEDEQLALDPGEQAQLAVGLAAVVEEVLELVLRGQAVGLLRALQVQVVVVLLQRSGRQLELLVPPLEEHAHELFQVSDAVPVQDPVEAFDSHAVVVQRETARHCLVKGKLSLEVLEEDLPVELR